MKEKVYKAAMNYFSISYDGEYLGESNGFLIFFIDEGIVFVNVTWCEGKFGESNAETLKQEYEFTAAQWLKEHEDFINIPVRCDEIALNILDDKRAFLRHHVNAIQVPIKKVSDKELEKKVINENI